MKVVLDTNLFVAAYWNKNSSSNEILELAKAGKFGVVWSKDTREETQFILGKIKAQGKFLRLIDSIFKEDSKVYPAEKVSILKDYADNRLLEAAKIGNADYLVTADRDVLYLKIFGKTKIIKPSGFLSEIKNL